MQVLRWTVALTYVFAYAAIICGWLPWTCALSLVLSVPTVSTSSREITASITTFASGLSW